MSPRERGGILEGHDGVAVAMKDERRLAEIREGGIAARVFHELITYGHFSSFRIMKDADRAIFSPLAHPIGSEFIAPKPVKTKGGRKQEEPVDGGMRGCVEGGEIAPETGTDQDSGLLSNNVLDEVKLATDRELLEAAAGQVWNFEADAERGELGGEEARLVRSRAGGEAVQIQDTQTRRQHLHFKRTADHRDPAEAFLN